MEKAKKNRIKKYITWVCIVSIVVTLTLLPILAGSGQELTGPQASILSGTVETGSITDCLYGGGTLSSQSAVEITLPEGVKITEFLVTNGDLVSEGDPLAMIDPVSVMTTITGVQDTMDYLVEEMSKINTQQSSTYLTAKAGGLLKQVFAEEGDDVQEVMLEHGALAVVSLDGMMAVDIVCDTKLSIGDRVCVLFEDGLEIPGWVESNMDGILIVTVEDDGYEVGTAVQVTDADGNPIGTGNLYVHNAWRAVAYSGTVQYVNAKPETNLYPGQAILTLKENSFSGQVESLASQHRKYEALMLELFQLYQTNVIPAPCDGLISGVDENSVLLLSAESRELSFQRLANAPGSDPEGFYENYVGQLEMILGNFWIIRLNPEAQPITDYKEEISSLDTATEKMRIQTMLEPVTVYRLVEDQWEITTPQAGDILVFAMDAQGFVWAVYAGNEDLESTETTAPPDTEEESAPTEDPTDPEQPTLPEGWENIELPEGWEDIELPEGWEDLLQGGLPNTQLPTIGGSMGGMFGGYSGAFPQETESPLYSLEKTTLLSVIPQQEMTLKMQLDERDISKVQIGMPAEVTVNAIRATFPAVVIKIGDRGINLGGSSKFTVELLLEMNDDMLSGMSATATIPLSVTQDVPVIPVEALVEAGSKTIVYTGYDEKNDVLLNPVDVVCGHSDGIYVEILSGLNLGDTYWYQYYDTLELDHSVEEPAFGFG